jgi:hypothetical protein
MACAFAVGIVTSNNVKPAVEQTRAGGETLEGDMNGNGNLDPDDAKIALELAQGYRTPTPQELAADPNHDYKITQDDAMLILDKLSRLPQRPTVEL